MSGCGTTNEIHQWPRPGNAAHATVSQGREPGPPANGAAQVKVRELIEILSKCPQEMDAVIAYDSFTCVAPVEHWDIAVLTEGDDWKPAGVYLCSWSAQLSWRLNELDDKCDYPLIGYRPEGCYPEPSPATKSVIHS